MTSENFAQATQHLEDARDAISNLEHVHATGYDDKRLVAALYDQIRQNLKLSEVAAQLAQVEAFDRLAHAVESMASDVTVGTAAAKTLPGATEQLICVQGRCDNTAARGALVCEDHV